MAKSGVGLDIGSFSIKLVEIENDNGRYKLKNFYIRDLYGEGEEFDAEGPGLTRLETSLRNVFDSLRINPKRLKNINTSICGPSISVKEIKSIPLAPEELQSSLLFEARKHLPLDESEAVIDYQVLKGDMQTQEMEIMLVATTKKVFDNHLKALKSVGVDPHIIDAGTLALANSYIATHGPVLGEEALVFLDIGAKYTAIAIAAQHSMFFTRDLTWGGANFTEDIKGIMKLEYAEAEAIKRERGMGAFIGENAAEAGGVIKVSRRMAIDNLIDEIRRSLRYYTKETGCRDFQKILLSGGSAALPNLNSHLAAQLNLAVEKYNPFATFSTPPGFDDVMGTRMAIACGLALRED
jgi:type IV pilus assembly protein PilM